MRKVSVKDLQPGMVIARTVYSPFGEPLLKKGIEVRSAYINNLKRLGINAVYVEDERMEGAEAQEIISEESKLEAKQVMREYKNCVTTKSVYREMERPILNVVDKIIYEVINKDNVVLDLYDIKTADSYTYDHCLSVGTLSVILGIKHGLTYDELLQVGLGSFLHDLGKNKVPPQILNKNGSLTSKEFNYIKEHPLSGYNKFKKSPIYSEIAGNIILQHHERYEGHGYPYGLKRSQISPYAQIVAISDVYDAITSDRPYRKAFAPHEAIEMFLALGGIDFDLNILNTFLSFIPAYPVGTHVILNNGESGLVIGNTPGFPNRPKIRILYKHEKGIFSQLRNPYEVDLSQNTDLVVSSVKK